MDGKAILGLEFFCDDLDRTLSIREYLIELLTRLWDEGESFSGKRPFGNSGWQYDLYAPLIRAGAMPGTLDEGGYIEDCDDDAGDRLIASAIAALSQQPEAKP